MKCVICKKPAKPEHSPFCSARCKLIDLNKWISGEYVIPGSEEEDLEKSENNEESL